LDALNKLGLGFRYRQNLEPRDIYVSRRVNDLMSQNPHLNTVQLWSAKRQYQDEYTREERIAKAHCFTLRTVGPEAGRYTQ
jgi:hypothetical protein